MATQRETERTGRYLHGTTPEEQERLTLMNDTINAASLRELRLSPGDRVLDVGAGLAQLTRQIARLVQPGGRVVGVERSPAQIAEARRQARAAGEEGLVDLRQGDVFSLPLAADEWGTFDMAHARFVLEHLPDPLEAVRAMVRAVRPDGGRIVLEDDDNDLVRLWPEPPGFGALWQAYTRTFDRNGNDPFVGRRLVSLLHQAGARPVRTAVLSLGACAGMPTLVPIVEIFVQLFEGVHDDIVGDGILDRRYFADALAALRTWSTRPDAAFWLGISYAEGVRER